MTGEGLFVAGLFAVGLLVLLALAVRWRQRSPRLALAAALWAAIAYALPAMVALLPPGALATGDHESQPYVALGILWLFLLVPSLAGIALGRAYLRSK